MINRLCKIINWSTGVLFLSLCVTPVFANFSDLSLDKYLSQVIKKNYGVNSSEYAIYSALLRQEEAKLLTQPSLFAEGQYLKNSLDSIGSVITGNAGQTQSYKLGLSETTPYGIEGKVYYSYQKQILNGVGLNILSPLQSAQIFSSSPVFELSVPLLRNWAGKETRATRQVLKSQSLLTKFSENYKIKSQLAQAESAYWKLAICRQIVNIQMESLERAQKITSWVSDRKKLRLAEDSDLLQANAAVETKKLDIQNAIEDEKLAAHNFNSLRGSDQEKVNENLISYNKSSLAQIKFPIYQGPKDDVKAALQERNINVANAMLGIEKNKPNVELYGSYAFNGNNPVFNQAIADSFTTNYPSTAIGVRLSIPLNMKGASRIRNGYRIQIESANYQYKQLVYDDKRQWQGLILQFNNIKKRLNIASQLEHIQQQKLNTEKERLLFGKTTTFQVLTFEQDYANAQLSKLIIQDQLLSVYAQTSLWKVK